MTPDGVADVHSTIGNLIRIALAVEVEEAEDACASAGEAPLQIALLNPRRAPESPNDDRVNFELLQAFLLFRKQIEAIRFPVNATGLTRP